MGEKLRFLTPLLAMFGWIFVISLSLGKVIAKTKPPPKVVIIRWPACEDLSNCGDCELMLRPVYLLPVCEQKNCQLMNAIPPVNQLPSSMGLQGFCKGEGQLALYRRKVWSDCNQDGNPDCECWTWYWRDKNDPSRWYIGISCDEEEVPQ